MSLLSGHASRLLWPLMHVYWMTCKLKGEKRSDKEVRAAQRAVVPVLAPLNQLVVMSSTLPRAAMAALLLHLHFPIEEAKEMQMGWMLNIVIRDLTMAFLLGFAWDFLLYSKYSPFSERMAKYKFNPEYPSTKQILHDMSYTAQTMVCGALIEIVMLHLWATGSVSYTSDFWAAPCATLAWVLTMKHWRHTHFWFMHRGMHPWRTKTVPDLGRWLYKNVHKEHHKSPNPTSWSGVSMHPIEGTAYFTAALIPCFFGAHPIAFAVCKLDLWLGAMIGHDGFGFPGGGGIYHYLHHENYEINYGEPTVPLDWFFGTYGEGPTKAKDY